MSCKKNLIFALKTVFSICALSYGHSASALMVCSWDLARPADHPASPQYVLPVAQACDVLSLQGLSGSMEADRIHTSLIAFGDDWGRLPPLVDEPGNAILFQRDKVRYAGRHARYPGSGGGVSARFDALGQGTFVVAALSPRPKSDDEYDLSSYVGWL